MLYRLKAKKLVGKPTLMGPHHVGNLKDVVRSRFLDMSHEMYHITVQSASQAEGRCL